MGRESLQRRHWQHLQSQLRVIIACHFTRHCNVTRQGAVYSCTLGAGPSIIFIRLHNLQIGPVCILDYRCLARVFSHHQVWMFARLSESKLVAGRFACCGSYLGNCCHAISGGRVKRTITIKTPRMMKDFQGIFSFLFLSISSQFPVEPDNNNSPGLGPGQPRPDVAGILHP